MYELALNPEIQSRLRQEINTGVEKNNGILTYDLLCDLKYLDMATYECLRKYPPVPTLFRRCLQDYKIAGTSLVIPKGTIIFIPTFSIHHDKGGYEKNPYNVTNVLIEKTYRQTFILNPKSSILKDLRLKT